MTRWTGVAVVLVVLVAGATWAAEAPVRWEVMGDGYVPVSTPRAGQPTVPPRADEPHQMMPAGGHMAATPGAHWFVMGDGYVSGDVTPAGTPVEDPCGLGCSHGCHGGLAYSPANGDGAGAGRALQ